MKVLVYKILLSIDFLETNLEGMDELHTYVKRLLHLKLESLVLSYCYSWTVFCVFHFRVCNQQQKYYLQHTNLSVYLYNIMLGMLRTYNILSSNM